MLAVSFLPFEFLMWCQQSLSHWGQLQWPSGQTQGCRSREGNPLHLWCFGQSSVTENKGIEERRRGNKKLWRLESDLKCYKKVIMQRRRFRQRTGYRQVSICSDTEHLLPGYEKEVDKWGSKVWRQEKMLWVRENQGRWRSRKNLLLTEKHPALEGVLRGNVFRCSQAKDSSQ